MGCAWLDVCQILINITKRAINSCFLGCTWRLHFWFMWSRLKEKNRQTLVFPWRNWQCKIEKEKFQKVHFGFETFTYTWRWMNDIINPNGGRGINSLLCGSIILLVLFHYDADYHSSLFLFLPLWDILLKFCKNLLQLPYLILRNLHWHTLNRTWRN